MLASLIARLIPFKAWLVGALALSAAGAIGVQTYRLDRAQGALALEQAQHATTRALLTAQEVGVRALEAESKVLEARAKAAEEKEAEVVTVTKERVRVIRETPKPQNCTAAIEFLVREAAGDLK